MKKNFLVVISLVLVVFCIAACGSEDDKKTESVAETEDVDALEILQSIWKLYGEEDRFSVVGGDALNMQTDEPGAYNVFDADGLTNMFYVPEDKISMLDSAATLMHAMNANTFTCGAFHIKSKQDMTEFTDSLKAKIGSAQWICGTPDELLIAAVNDNVVCAFGEASIMDGFKEKLKNAYPYAKIFYEEAIVEQF